MHPEEPVTQPDARQALIIAYWKIRDHADAYRDTTAFRKTRQAWEAARASTRQNGRTDAYTKHVVHEFYARGIEAAAREIAELLGVPEHEIERAKEPA